MATANMAFPVPTFHPENKPYRPPYHQQYDTRGHFMTYGEDNLEEDLRNMRKKNKKAKEREKGVTNNLACKVGGVWAGAIVGLLCCMYGRLY